MVTDGGAPAVGVWWARAGRHDWRALVRLLDSDEVGRLEALRREEDQERFVLAASLARAALATLLATEARDVALDRTCARCGAPHGKPRLAAPRADLELSITHSGTLVGVAVCPAVAVGLDVERLDRLDGWEHLAATVLSPGERTAVEQAAGGGDRRAGARAFLTMWTRKEALTKMSGSGITVPLPEVVVSGPADPARCLALPGDLQPGTVALHDLDAPATDHVAAVAAAHPGAVPSVHDGDRLVAALPR